LLPAASTANRAKEVEVKQFSLIALPIAALFPGVALSQPANEGWRDEQTVTVTAARTARDTDETPQSVSVLDEEAIETRQSATVLDLLRTLPGLTTTTSGAPGAIGTVSIRGAESDHTLVLIDGVKINDPASTGGGYNFGTLLTGNIERIEVVRGPRSVLYGSQAIGGVVNLITRAPQPGEGVVVNARAEAGGRETYNAVGNVAASVGPIAASLGGGWYKTDGFSAFNVRRGGIERDGYEQWHANGRVAVALGENAGIDLRGSIADGRTDIDGFTPSFTFGDTLQYGDQRDITGYAGVNFAFGPLKNRVGYAVTRVERTDYDPEGFLPITYDSVGTNERLEYQGVATFDWAEAVFGAEREWSRFDADSFGTPERGRATLDSFYGELTARPVSGLTLSGGVRHDEHDRFGGATTLSAGGVFTPNDGATRVRASYGEGFKVPSLYQLYGSYGNEALVPETSESWEIGVDQRLMDGQVELGAVYFRRDTENQIDFASCPPASTTAPCIDRPFGVYDNLRLTRAEGVEFTLALKPVERLSVIGQYSFVDAKDRLTGNELARRPRHSVSALVDYAWPFGLTTGATVTHIGDRFDNAANTTRVDGHALVDIRASFPVTQRIELYGRVENLFDERYEVVATYGTPGRAAFGGVRIRL
jgi:vitamin B12 transporter